jgi:hypothetical protein
VRSRIRGFLCFQCGKRFARIEVAFRSDASAHQIKIMEPPRAASVGSIVKPRDPGDVTVDGVRHKHPISEGAIQDQYDIHDIATIAHQLVKRDAVRTRRVVGPVIRAAR